MTHKVRATLMTPLDTIISDIQQASPDDIELDLSGTFLGGRAIESMAKLLDSIPGHIRKLNLACNGLYVLSKKVYAEDLSWELPLTRLLSHIPPCINELSLEKNGLGVANHNEFIMALRTLPPTITTLNLANNHLGKMSNLGLQYMLCAIPRTVTRLDLSGQKLSLEQITWMLDNWPSQSRIEHLRIDTEHLPADIIDNVEMVLSSNNVNNTTQLPVSSIPFLFFTPPGSPEGDSGNISPIAACRNIDPDEWDRFINDNPSP